MKFGSWTFNGDQVSLALYNNKNFVDLSDYWKSGTWDIIEVPAYLNIYEGNHPTETDITFYIIIRRKTLFYTVNLILPTVLISFLCVLVFYLPAEAGEKVRIVLIEWIQYSTISHYPPILFIPLYFFLGNVRYQHSAVTGCVPATGVEDSPADLSRATPDCQVPPLYFHHEHRQYSRHGHHY